MSCCHHYHAHEGNESTFTVDPSRITFGAGCITELGERAAAYVPARVAVFTDQRIRGLAFFDLAMTSLKAAGLSPVVFDEVTVEPTDQSFQSATQFARETKADLYISIGGGSVIDTCKAANLYVTWPAPFIDYVNAPVGRGVAVPGPLKPHIACPTTCGTGSECTGIAVFDFLALRVKTGIAARVLRPTEALIDPDSLVTLPRSVLAASGFDVLSHAAESYTAVPYTQRLQTSASSRPMSQGANPWSDMGCERALKLLGEYFRRALADDSDQEARSNLMWAATLAGIAFGNAGVHLPHGMSYAVAGLVEDYYPRDYPQDHAMVPHGMSVIVNAPAVFASTADSAPKRHLDVARWLGADVSGAADQDAGFLISRHLLDLMQAADFPMGLADLGYEKDDVARLVAGAWPQQRLLKNAPCETSEALLRTLFEKAMQY